MTPDLPELNRLIQLEVGTTPDRRWGPVTAAAVWEALRARRLDLQSEKIGPATTAAEFVFDARSEKYLATLDPKARPAFRKFLALAQGVAASLGCDYIMISGHRTWAEQDALFAKRPVVTRARGGYSWHNFGVAGDCGVFRDGVYLDGGNKAQAELAGRVHKAVSLIAAEAGISWGGNWKSMVDMPHFHLAQFPASPTAAHRRLYLEKQSVL